MPFCVDNYYELTYTIYDKMDGMVGFCEKTNFMPFELILQLVLINPSSK